MCALAVLVFGVMATIGALSVCVATELAVRRKPLGYALSLVAAVVVFGLAFWASSSIKQVVGQGGSCF